MPDDRMPNNINNRTDEIKQFWDDRARKYKETWQATLGERYLRLLEIKIIIKFIKSFRPHNVLDVGCGNGYSTKIFAKKFPDINFVGIDYSEEMILLAEKNETANCKFFLANVLDMDTFKEDRFDIIMSQRCLQNLVDYKSQCKAIKNLLLKKTPRGILLLMECSKDGVEQLNRARVKFGRKPLLDIEPWHNNFFVDKKLIDDFQAETVYFSSTYMFLAKVIDSRLSLLGYILPSIGKFGYDRLYIIR